MRLAVSSFFSFKTQLREETGLGRKRAALCPWRSAEMALHKREISTAFIHLRAQIHSLLSTYPIIFRTQAEHTLEKHQALKHTVIAVPSVASDHRSGPRPPAWRWAR